MTYSIILAAQQGNSMATLIMILAIVVVFYFFMIRPQNKRAKEQSKFVEEIKKGDQVVTMGGMHGRIAEIEGPTVVLEVERGGRIKLNKSAISMELTKSVQNRK